VTDGYLCLIGRIVKFYPKDFKTNPRKCLLEAASQFHDKVNIDGNIFFDAVEVRTTNTDRARSLGISDLTPSWAEPVCCSLLATQYCIMKDVKVGRIGKEMTVEVSEKLPYSIAVRRRADGNYYRLGSFWYNRESLDHFSQAEEKGITAV
jgi:hypothetical protein